MIENIYKITFPMGNYNYDMEVESTEDGLLLDEYAIIPWEWIDEMRKKNA